MNRNIIFPIITIIFSMGYIAGKYAELSWMKFYYYIIAIFGSWLVIKFIEIAESYQEEKDESTRNN